MSVASEEINYEDSCDYVEDPESEGDLDHRLDSAHLYWFHYGYRHMIETKAVCLYDCVSLGACGAVQKSLYREYFKMVRDEILKGVVVVRPKWVKSGLLGNQQWFVFVVECPSETESRVSTLGFVLGIHVVGVMYAFKNQANRDAIYQYLTKPA